MLSTKSAFTNVDSVCIVIVSYNSARLLGNCLSSIPRGAAHLDYEIIVVDNGSRDSSVEMLEREFPALRLIQNAENAGFARANNQGWHASRARYALFLNSDTQLPAQSLSRLIEFMEEHPETAACGPHLARADGTTQPFAFGGDPTVRYLLARGINHWVFRRALHDWETRTVQNVDWVSGASLLARRAALEQVGGFDEFFFLYFEDNDLCLRMRRAGWKILYNPQVTITHLGGLSMPPNQARQKFYDASLRQFYAKHYARIARLALEMMLPFYRKIHSR